MLHSEPIVRQCLADFDCRNKISSLLWKEKDSEVIDTYQMDRLAFGDTSSPCEAIYVTRRTAKDHGQGQEDAVRAIKRTASKGDLSERRFTFKEVDVQHPGSSI